MENTAWNKQKKCKNLDWGIKVVYSNTTNPYTHPKEETCKNT